MAFRLYVYNVLSLVSRFLFTQASDFTTVLTDVYSLSILFAFQLTDNIASDLLFIPLMDLVDWAPHSLAAVALTQTTVLLVDWACSIHNLCYNQQLSLFIGVLFQLIKMKKKSAYIKTCNRFQTDLLRPLASPSWWPPSPARRPSSAHPEVENTTLFT